MIVIIVICIIILLTLLNKKEQFVNYKPVTVTPKKIVYDKLTINIPGNNRLYTNISNKIREIYPIKFIEFKNINESIINIEKYPNYIAFIPEIVRLTNPDKFKNTRFITSIGVEKPTLFSPVENKIITWKDLGGKTVGTIANSASYYILNYIKKSFNLKFKIKSIEALEKTTLKKFKNKIFDSFFMITAHPNNVIKHIHKNLPLKFIGLEGLDKENIKIIFPNYNKSKIDLTHYDIFNSMPDTVAIKIDILVNKRFSEENGYNLIQTVFKNLITIKSVGSDDYKLQMRDFNPEYIYLSNNNHKLHKGVYKFYKSIGLITNNHERSCRYKVGISQCNVKKINHFRLL